MANACPPTPSQLTSLEIVCVGLPPDVARLTSLQRLAHLLLVSHEQAPQPAGLAWLGEPYAPGARAKPAALELPLPSSLPTLASFEYTVPGGMEVRGLAAVGSGSCRVWQLSGQDSRALAGRSCLRPPHRRPPRAI